jgi:LuxR family maltose regulon positive regulatory protein
MRNARSSLPVKAGLLERPRIGKLLDLAVRNTLVTVIAGPGYGKTCEVAAYAQKAPVRLVWMNISRLDITLERFWGNFILALKEEFPALAKQCRSLGFPLNASAFETFLQAFAEEIYKGEQVLFVVDDFGYLEGSEIKYFFENLIEANLENFSLILLCAARTDVGVAALHGGSLYQITADDLRFTMEETSRLFAQYGRELSPETLKALERNIGGWPMALNLFSQEHGEVIYRVAETKLNVIDEMFEREFFSLFSLETQKLLVKLSLIHGFSFDIAMKISGFDIAELERALKSNAFIMYDNTSRSFTFQNMYRAFLASKQFMLSDEEKSGFWFAAGETFLSLGYALDAIDCFEKCGRPDKTLQSIVEYMNKHTVFSREHAEYLMKKLLFLDKELVGKNPIVEFLIAVALVNNLELKKAYGVLEKLAEKLEGLSDRGEPNLLGEVYWVMGQVNMLLGRPIFASQLKAACENISGGSERAGYLHIRNIDLLTMENALPGALERIEEELHEAMPYYTRLAKGGGSGMEYLFSAEAGYFRFDFNYATQNAHKAIYAATDARQHDILCDAHIILSRIAIMRGDCGEAATHAMFARDYINEREISELYEMRDCAMATLYVAVGDYNRMARWIVSPDPKDAGKSLHFVVGGREKIIQGEYLLGVNKYYEALAFLEHNEEMYRRQGRWINVLKCLVLHAVAHLRLGDADSAISVFRDAYEMSYANKLVTPFIESAGNMRSLVDAARKCGKYQFDQDWLDDIYRKSATHAKRLSVFAGDYYQRNSISLPPAQKLSKRETEVLDNLSQGLTREEIAEANSLSINTIKSVIKSVYNKLGAVNRADAIRIATSMGILK